MSWINSRLKAANEEAGALVTHVQWSENGTTESSNLTRTAVTLGDSTDADPSVIANSAEIETAEASDGATISHFAFAADDTLQTAWIELDTSRTLLTGDKIVAPAGNLSVSLSTSS